MHVVEFFSTIFASKPGKEYRLDGTVINVHIQFIFSWNIAVKINKKE
jgi:hypothetical protein